MQLCVNKLCQDINKYDTLSTLPRDISQQVFNELVYTKCLTEVCLEAFRDCALQDIYLGEYPAVGDKWMDIISSQGLSLLSVDVSGSEVTDSGLSYLKGCTNLQSLTFDFCDYISDRGLGYISGKFQGLSNLTSLSFRRNASITAQGMSALSCLVNLVKLDLERCLGIHGGLVHLRGLTALMSLNVSNSRITSTGLQHTKPLKNLLSLSLEACKVTASDIRKLQETDLPNLLSFRPEH